MHRARILVKHPVLFLGIDESEGHAAHSRTGRLQHVESRAEGTYHVVGLTIVIHHGDFELPIVVAVAQLAHGDGDGVPARVERVVNHVAPDDLRKVAGAHGLADDVVRVAAAGGLNRRIKHPTTYQL